MGWGDEVLALGRAEREFMRTGRPVAIIGLDGQRRANLLWDGNPAVDPGADATITDGPNARPYIERWEGSRIILNMKHRPRAGRVMLTQEERYWADFYLPDDLLERGFAVVSPHIKGNASINKSWGAGRWTEAIKDFPLPVLQLGPSPIDIIPGAQYFETPTMRHAAAVIALAKIVLTNEGGSHHLAASMGTRAVVVFGGFMHPKVTGYPQHSNLIGDPMHVGCGKYEPCPACRNSLDKITPAMVKHAAKGILHGRH